MPAQEVPHYDFKAADPGTAAVFGVSMQAFLDRRRAIEPSISFTHIGTGAVVFNHTRTAVLLVQRAPTDSMPNLWEVPGGAVDDDDPTLLHAVARELWEEAGLVARTIGPAVSSATAEPLEFIFQTRSGRVVAKYQFLVGVADDAAVRLDLDEHQDFAWASESECREERMTDGRSIPMTTASQKLVIMEAWRMLKEQGGGGGGVSR